jgi:tetratricopeptide (TPR) repeat protein
MCGGALDVAAEEKVGTCTYCGTTQTLPRLDEERRVTLYDRANHYRMTGDFDKASGIYETILNEDVADAEAYWSLVLCRYGIEYVEDPKSHKRIPTCNRTLYTSVLQDADYLQALEHADVVARGIYEQEAQAIDSIQKGILELSAKEQPYDVFICFKDTAEDGSRTKDSVLAQDIYHQLAGEGYRVFFSRITLEGKLGEQYEPYIFAALSSAKVMLVIGTKPEYIKAVWVKNEWSRFLALAHEDRSKLLIPCYRDLDVYDLPDELSLLQSQDMGKIGFMQDLLHGVEKVVRGGRSATSPARATTASGNTASAGSGTAPGVESLYKRMKLFLEDKEFTQADEYADRILDIDPEYAPVYMGKLLAELQISREEELSAQAKASFTSHKHFLKALRFADDSLREVYEGYTTAYEERLAEEKRTEEEWQTRLRREEAERKERERQAEEERKEREYQEAEQLLEAGEYGTAYRKFDGLGQFKDAAQRALIIAKEHPFYIVGESGVFGGITWQALAVEGHNALIITKDIIEQKRFDVNSNNWQNSEIKRWLHGDFLEKISASEQRLIQNVNNKGVGTTDQIFLLSIDEVNRYFPSQQSRIASYDDEAFWWWLRSPGSGDSDYAAYVGDDGNVYTYGVDVDLDGGGVRPVLWLNLKSEIAESLSPQDNGQDVPGQNTANVQANYQQQQAEQARIWESQGLCRYCGGKLSLFGNKCKSCGQQN